MGGLEGFERRRVQAYDWVENQMGTALGSRTKMCYENIDEFIESGGSSCLGIIISRKTTRTINPLFIRNCQTVLQLRLDFASVFSRVN